MRNADDILKFLDGKLKGPAKDAVLVWKNQNPRDFDLIELIWQESSNLGGIKSFDVDEEFAFFENSISEDIQLSKSNATTTQTTKVVDIARPKNNRNTPIWRAFLAVASLALIVFIAFNIQDEAKQIIVEAEAIKKDIILPDNTVVKLDENATISYPSSFEDSENRIILLDGTAIFEVTEDKTKPFIVETPNSGVRALGTVFRVDAKASETGVENLEGLIKFFDIKVESKNVIVNEGESFVYDGSDFTNTTAPEPEPEPVITELTIHPLVEDVLYTLGRLTNGTLQVNRDKVDLYKEIDVNLEVYDTQTLINRIKKVSYLKSSKQDCDTCLKIESLRVK